MFSSDIGIDLGTANTLIFIKGKGIMLRQPSIVSFDTKNNKVIFIGDKTNNNFRNNHDIISINPLKEGVISDFDIATNMIEDFIKKTLKSIKYKKPKVVISIPTGITDIQKRAVMESVQRAGAKKVYVVESPMAVAIGEDLNVFGESTYMVVDIGGGTTEAALISFGEIVSYNSSKIAGDELDLSIVEYIKRNCNVSIGKKMAEKLKIEIGCIHDTTKNKSMCVKGMDLTSYLPIKISVTSNQIKEALQENIYKMLNIIVKTFEKASDEMVNDIKSNGIVLSGGTSLLSGFKELISEKLNIPVYICDNPFDSVISGAGKIVENMRELHDVLYEYE